MLEPKIIPQLGIPLGGSACGDMSVAMSWYIASEGNLDLSDRRAQIPRIVRQLAVPLRLPTGGTFPDELERAYQGAAARFEKSGLQAPQMRRMWTASFDDVLVPAMLKRDRSAIVGVWYGVINRLIPEVSGQLGLATWHWVVITNLRRVPRKRLSYPVRPGQDPDYMVRAVTLLDPLADGRTSPGRTTPVWKGPATVELSVIRQAAGKVGKKKDGSGTEIGDGRVVGGIFGVVKPLSEPVPEPVPEPEPEPVDPCDALRVELTEARSLLALYEARLEDIGDMADQPIEPELEDGSGAPEDAGDPGIVDPVEDE